MTSIQDAKHKESIEKKTKLIRERFNLPQEEILSQNYFCVYKSKPGNIYITQNFVVYIPNVGLNYFKIPFRTVKNVEKKKSLLGNCIIITDDAMSYTLSKFAHFDEAYYLLNYIIKNPLVLIKELPAASSFANGESFGTVVKSKDGGPTMMNSSTRNISTNVNSGQMQSQMQVQVDLQAGNQAIQSLASARQLGFEAMNELAVQQDMLNNIENNVESLHLNVDQANQHLNGVESFAGQVKNSAFHSHDSEYQSKEFGKKTINMMESSGPLTINVLRKRENTSLAPAVISFHDKDFSINDSLAKREFRYQYKEIREIAIRNRSLHMDLRFHSDARERIVSSYSQTITNEIVLRADSNIQVSFETYAIRFEYGNPELRQRLFRTNQIARANESAGCSTSFVRRSNQVSAEVANASDQYKEALQIQENQIDTIADYLVDLNYAAHAIGQAVDNQNEQINRITLRTEEGTEKMHQSNVRMQKMINE